MAAECAICLNSVMEAASSPPPVTGSNGVGGAIPVGSAPPAPRKQFKNCTTRTLEDSTSLEDTFATPCGHIFHAQCLKQVFAATGRGVGHRQIASCPTCRKPVTKRSLLQIFLGGGVQVSDGPSPGSSAASSISNVPSQSSNSAASASSGSSAASAPGPSGSRKRNAPGTDNSDGTVGNQEHGDELQDLQNLLTNSQDARKLAIQRIIQNLVHACQCRDLTCALASCVKFKKVVAHAKVCKRKTQGGCFICKQLIALCCYHAKYCDEIQCLVPFCSNIKQKLRRQRTHERLQQNQQIRRRVAQMQTMLAEQNAPMMGGWYGVHQLPGNAPLGQPIQQQQQVVERSAQGPQFQFVLHQQPNQLGNLAGVGNPQMWPMGNNLVFAGMGNQMNAATSNQMQLQMPIGQLANQNFSQLGFQLNNPTLPFALQQPGSAHPATSPPQMGLYSEIPGPSPFS